MPIYLIAGEDAFLRQEARQSVMQTYWKPGFSELAYKKLQQPTLALAQEAISSVAMVLGGVLPLIEIEALPVLTGKTDESDKAVQIFMSALEEVAEAKCVVLSVEKLNQRLKVSKQLLQAKWVTHYDCAPLKFWESDKAIQQLQRMCKAKQITVSSAILQYMVDLLGVDLQRLHQELDKLVLFAHGRAITKADVDTVCEHHTSWFNVLDLWVSQRAYPEVFDGVQEALLNRHPIELIAVTQTTVGNFLRAKMAVNQGQSAHEIATVTGQSPYIVKKNLEKLRGVSLDRLLMLKHALTETEWHMKTGQVDSQEAMLHLMAL